MRKLPYIPLIIGSIASLVSFFALRESNELTLKLQFETHAKDFSEQYRDYTNAIASLKGSAALFAVNPNLTRAEFRKWCAARNYMDNAPAAMGLGFIRYVPKGSEDAFLKQTRVDAPDFEIKTLGPNVGDRYIIEYIEPLESNKSAQGLDTGSEARRLKAVEHARRTGEITFSSRIRLVQPEVRNKWGFLIFCPVFKGGGIPATEEERIKNFLGAIYAPLVIDRYIAETGSLTSIGLGFNIYDETETGLELLYDSDGVYKKTVEPINAANYFRPQTGLEFENVINQYGVKWKLQVFANKSFVYKNLSQSHWFALALGILLSCLATISWSLVEKSSRYESDARFRALFEQAAIGVVRAGIDGKILDINKRCAELLKRKTEDLLQLTIEDLIHQEDRPAAKKSFESLLNGQLSTYSMEKRYLHPDGTVIWCSVTNSLVRDDRGLPLYTIRTLEDITERKKAEEDRNLSEAKTRAIFQQAHQFVGLLDVNGVLMQANDTALKFVGAKFEDVVGKPFDQTPWWTHSTELQSWLRIAIKQAAKGEFVRQETTHVGVDGKTHIVDFSLKPAHNHLGEIVWLIPEGRDITDIKKSEFEARVREAEIRALFNSAIDAIFILNEEGTVVSVNNAATRILGFSSAELLGGKLENILPEKHRTGHVNYIRRYLQTGEQKILGAARELEAVRKDGTVIPILLSVSEAVVDSNRIFMGVMRDLQKEKEAEIERQQLQLQLFHIQKMDSLGVLAGGIAHDFNNIVAAILGYAELAAKWHTQDPRTANAMQKIITAGERARDLVKQILAFSRREAPKCTPIDLVLLTKEVQGLLNAALPRNIELVLSKSESSHLVQGDPGQVHQVLMNLCTNGIQAMPNGGTLEIGVRSCDFSSEQVKPNNLLLNQKYHILSVKDSGKGIPPDILPRIFEPFFTTKGLSGTGLGLATVHGIVRQHNGVIDVQSILGQGTEFIVYLPALVLEEARSLTRSQMLPAIKKLRILILDDEPNVLELTKDMLASMGFDAAAFSEFSDVMRELTEHPDDYDLVLTDFRMPDIDGAEVCRQIKERFPKMKVGIFTAFESVDLRPRVLAAGGDFIMMKPFTSYDLASQLSAV